jgi:hypothetical protein
MDVRGDCLAPEVNDGDYIIADASAHPENGDLACVLSGAITRRP